MDWNAALADPIVLRAQGLFLAEGRLVLESVLAGAAGGPEAIVSVLATPAAAGALSLATRVGDRLETRSPREMEAVTGFNFHRGVIALVRRPAPISVEDLLSRTLPPLTFPDGRASATATSGEEAPAGVAVSEGRRPHDEGRPDAVVDSRFPTPDSRPLFVLLEHLVDVDNVGSCFRNARAFGAAGVLVDERCADPLYRKAVRTSQGATLVVPWAQGSVLQMLAGLAARGVTTVGLTPQGSAGDRAVQTLIEVDAALDPRTPVAVIVGNEGSGLSAATLAACTHLARIPMAPGADSINVATSLAVALYQLT